MGFHCLHEISRKVTLDARKEGIPQLFLSDPLLFSERVLEGRLAQFDKASQALDEFVFLDRGLPDVVAYMDCFQQEYNDYFTQTCAQNRYDAVFLLPPWMEIHVSDNERFENYEEAMRIHECLASAYKDLGYHVIDVPKLSINRRIEFIFQILEIKGGT